MKQAIQDRRTHLLSGRKRLFSKLGGKEFLIGKEKAAPGSSPLDRLWKGLEATGRELVGRIGSLDDKALSAPIDAAKLPFKPPKPLRGTCSNSSASTKAATLGRSGLRDGRWA